MNEILKKAQTIIQKAEDAADTDFFSEYSNCLIATGERSSDYSLYCIDISDDYLLFIDFQDFGLDDFSIVHKGHKQTIYQTINFIESE